ncbi:Tetratricopeptide repeat-containing protein [Brevinema andersonii]|uniref:Tetratricopeptide repeat-containing protein n=1 Tax=Brevinema andersonii TaxID=34097 RepID=A0A1I1DWN0_BREAD|nr:tetratricopeptide repeat protein [Brevinema andersonii]SFB78812.1 Tetratricopeptide repeat-containing protein [Brevinema andersonii]
MIRIAFLIFTIKMSIYAQMNEDVFQKQIIRNPQNLEAYIEYINSLKNSSKITEIGNKAIENIGEKASIYTAMGNAYTNANDIRRAISVYRKAIWLNPRSATSYNRLGLALLKLNLYRQAEVAFKAAISLSDNNNAKANYYAYLGLVLESSKEINDSEAAFKSALKLNPQNNIAKEGLLRITS